MDNPFHQLPDWKRFNFSHQTEKGDEWKDMPRLESAKKLYEQASQIFTTSQIFADSLTGDLAKSTQNLIMQNAMMLGAKIVGAEGGNLYILKMENASIIRTNCRELLVQINWAEMAEMCDSRYAEVLRNEIETFRHLFIHWVSRFEKDDTEDDWGLF